MAIRTSGRHRSDARIKTPLSDIADNVANNAGTIGRRSAVIAASSGLLMTMGIPLANAAPVSKPQDVNKSAAPVQPRKAKTAKRVFAPTTAKVNFATDALVTKATPAPKPQPAQQAQDEARQDRASRTATRTAVAAPKATKSQTQEAPAADVPMSNKRGAVIALAKRYSGIPYVWGGSSPSGFDCSGYTSYIFDQVGVNLPHSSSGQAAAGRKVSASAARPGDLVYFPGHIGIYAGGNMMYDAPRPGKTTGLREMWRTPSSYINVLGD